jgi:hypothetical protein
MISSRKRQRSASARPSRADSWRSSDLQGAQEFALRLAGVDLERQRGGAGQGVGDARFERIEGRHAHVQRAEQVHDVAVQADPEQGAALGGEHGGTGEPEQAERHDQRSGQEMGNKAGDHRAAHAFLAGSVAQRYTPSRITLPDRLSNRPAAEPCARAYLRRVAADESAPI